MRGRAKSSDWWNHRILLTSLLLFAVSGFGHAFPPEGARYPEYMVKAEMLIRFADFTTWPPELFHSPGTPFVLGIAGKDPFGFYLKAIAQSESIKGHPIQLRILPTTGPFDSCHALFIPKDEWKSLETILSQVKGLPILVVGDSESFIRRGAHIGFQTEKDRVKFGVNLPAARRCNLVFPSGLLRLAVKIYDEKE